MSTSREYSTAVEKVPADYRAGSHLRLLLEQMVQEVAMRIVERRASEVEAGMVKAPKHSD